MAFNIRSTLWGLKRYIWPLASAAGLGVASAASSALLQPVFAGALVYFLGREVIDRLTFKPYPLEGNNPDAWKALLQKFVDNPNALAFRGANRQAIAEEIKNCVTRRQRIQQSPNNLCGPISLLQFLSRHNPNVLVQTMCEYYENGCTYHPFYLQSSFWDRWFLLKPLQWFGFNLIPENTSKNPYLEGLAGAFKNTHNLLGYNRACFVEMFRGCTEPVKIIQWLEQAGYTAGQHLTLRNADNTQNAPSHLHYMLGGLNGVKTAVGLPAYHQNNRKDFDFIALEQRPANGPLNHLFNIAAGHWKLEPKKNANSVPKPNEYIRIHLKR